MSTLNEAIAPKIRLFAHTQKQTYFIPLFRTYSYILYLGHVNDIAHLVEVLGYEYNMYRHNQYIHQPPLVKELGSTLIALHALLEKFWWKSLNVTDDAILESSTVYDVKFSRIEGDTWSKNRHIKLSNSVIS